MAPRNHVVGGGPDPQGKEQFGGHVPPNYKAQTVSSELQKTADLTDVVSNEDLGGNHVLGGSTDPPGKDILGVFPTEMHQTMKAALGANVAASDLHAGTAHHGHSTASEWTCLPQGDRCGV